MDMAEAQSTALPWADLRTIFVLRDVRVVATFSDDGGAIVELLEKLECSEGRHYIETGERADRKLATHILDYNFSFGVPGVPDPLAGQAALARVVITGTHTNGKRIELRGDGWIGYDNDGNIEGNFEQPPVMITEETHFPPNPDLHEMTAEELEAHFNADYPMPKQFEDATVRVPAPSISEDD
jgi:hypothetical protein